MRGIDTQVRKVRRAIFREVANMAYNSKNLVEDMEAFLQTYYGLSDEEIESFEELSKARKQILLEEGFVRNE